MEYENDRLDRIEKMVEENNHILKSMRRGSRFGLFLNMIYWIAALGIGLTAYYKIQPYIDGAIEFYGSVKNTQEKMVEFPKSLNNIKNLIPNLK